MSQFPIETIGSLAASSESSVISGISTIFFPETKTASGYSMRWLDGEFTQLLLLAEQQGRTDVLSIRNPYPIQDDKSPFEPELNDLDDRVLG